jgi:hypothetical protein
MKKPKTKRMGAGWRYTDCRKGQKKRVANAINDSTPVSHACTKLTQLCLTSRCGMELGIFTVI